MGRIKTQLVKRVTLQLVRKHLNEFKPTFDENKPLITKYANVENKKLRNVIAGYVTRLMKNKERFM